MGDENDLKGLWFFIFKGLWFYILMWTCNACEQIPLNPNHINSMMVNHVIYSMKATSISMCVHDCMVLGGCQSFNYDMVTNMCEINSENSETAPGDIISINRKMFSDIKVWPKSIAKQCAGYQCGSGKRCVAGNPPDCVPVIKPDENYIGCFMDKHTRDIPLWIQVWGNTPQKCSETCFRMNYLYAGVQFGSHCFCGNSYGKYGQLPESRCNVTCPGDHSQICGGPGANSVYGLRRNSVYRKIQSVARYIGCFTDSSVRDISVHLNFPQHNTPQQCSETCFDLGYLYAGVQDGQHCFCGNTYGRYGQLPESSCSSPCSGNQTQICGGLWMNSVYSKR